MKRLLIFPLLSLLLIFIAGCSGSKQIVYWQNIDSVNLAASQGLYDAKIFPKDMLTITVNTLTPEASAPFNLSVSGRVGQGGQLSGSQSLQGYLVDNDGNINFPVVGKLHVAGLTKGECERLVAEKIAPYLSATERPIVTVRMSSFHVTVLGEVGAPKIVPVSTEKMNIVEAIASAGDLTIYGKRNNVILVRESPTGQRAYHRLNLKDANIFNSPYYYLQQNDIIYVEPNKTKARNSTIGTSTSLWISLLGIVSSITTLVFTILRK